MKKILLLSLAVFFVFSCGKDNIFKPADPFAGEDLTPENTIAKPGNYWECETRAYGAKIKGTITHNDRGIAEVKLDVTGFENNLGEIYYKGEKISQDNPIGLNIKVSTNTVATFDYKSLSTDDPFVLVKFDGKEGDKYTHESDGNTLVREITKKDFEVEAFGWVIKTFQVDEIVPKGTFTVKNNGNELDITKIRYLINHRFGLVNVQLYVNDNNGFPFIIIDALNTNCDTK